MRGLLAASLGLVVLLSACAAKPVHASEVNAEPLAVVGPVPVLSGLFDGLAPEGNLDNYGLVVEDLDSGAFLAHNERAVFPSASLYKLGVAWLALRRAESGALNLDDPLPIEDEDYLEAEPDGGVAPGDTPTVREALGVMLTRSSNAAAHALLRILGRTDFNEEMDRIDLSQTRVPLDSSDSSAEVAETSAADMAHLLRLLATSPLLGGFARADLRGWLSNIAPPDALRDTLPPDVEILDKTGNLDDASNVGALLRSARGSVILVVLDQGVDPGDARGLIAQLG